MGIARKLKKLISVLSLFATYFITHTMNEFKSNTSINSQTINPIAIIDCYNLTPNNDYNNGALLTNCLHSSIIITPDQKNIIIGTKGEVHKASIHPAFGIPDSELLIKHQSDDYCPIITVAQADNNSLMIASALNYFNTLKNKVNSEIIFYKNKSYTIKELKGPIQTIKFAKNGTLLIAANISSIILFDLEQDCMDMATFHPVYKGNRIIDIAINENSRQIIMAGKQGIVQLATIHFKNQPRTLQKKNSCLNHIQKISFPTPETILCATQEATTLDTKAQTLNIFNILNDTDTTEFQDFAYFNDYEKVALDTGWNIASAHWTKNKNSNEENRHTIKISRINNDAAEIITLQAPTVIDRYSYISKTGNLKEKNECFFDVTLRNRTVAALSSCGKIFVWKIPKTTPPLNENIDTINQNTFEGEITDFSPRLIKKQSSTLTDLSSSLTQSNTTPPLTASEENTDELTTHFNEKKKKNTQSRIKISGIRMSPRSSPQDSPHNSPRGSKKDLSKEKKRPSFSTTQ